MLPSQRTRLDSWKAIAQYLGRNVRTVSRWAEKNGLPIYRVPGGKRQAIFAYADEIDAWLNGRGAQRRGEIQGSASVSGAHSDVPSQLPVQSANRISGLLMHKSLLVGFAVFAMASVWVLNAIVARRHASAAIAPARFIKLTDDSRPKASLRTDGNFLYFEEAVGLHKSLFSVPVQGGPVRQINIPLPNVHLLDVSRDGQRLLVTSYDGIESEMPLWIAPSKGGPAWRVGDIMCEFARWSPDNQRIAYVSGRTIGVASSDGTHKRTVASLTSSASKLAWSPDGKRLRFVLGDPEMEPSPWEIQIESDTDRTPDPPVRLPFGQNCCLDWGWTFDGSSFVDVRVDANDRQNLEVLPDKAPFSDSHMGQSEFPVRIGKIQSLAPDESNDAIYLLIESAVRGELLRIDSKSKSLQTILHGLSADYLSFSRDGLWMTYVNTVDRSLWRSRSNGTDAKCLTPPSMVVEVSSWSPDGQTIAFMGKTPESLWRIFLVRKDGGELTEAARVDDNQGGPSWSPDGNALIYANVLCQPPQECWIRRLDLTTRKLESLPGSKGLRTARFSPDGRYIAALQPDKHELMVFNVKSSRWSTLATSVTGDNILWARDSQSIFADSSQGEHPVLERFRVADGQRTTVANLASIEKMPGQLSGWIGLLPDDSPILLHLFDSNEIYSLDWKLR